MDYLTVHDIANQLDLSHHTIQKYIQRGKLPGRKLGRTWITVDWELKQYQEGVPVEMIQLAKLHDVQAAAEFLQADVNVVRRMIKAGRLEGHRIDKRGRFGGTQVFNQAQLSAAKAFVPEFLDSRSGRRVQDDIDKYIQAIPSSDDVVYYHIIGTHDRNHNEFAYKYLSQARNRAREAYKRNPLRYKKHDVVRVRLDGYPEGEKCCKAFFAHDVTAICKTATVKIVELEHELDEKEVLINVETDIVGNKS